jgi:hypothetical protein
MCECLRKRQADMILYGFVTGSVQATESGRKIIIINL